MARISSGNKITLPAESLERSGLKAGDDVAIEAEGPGTIIVRKVARDAAPAFGVFDGLYGTGYLDHLRARERT